MEQNQKTTTGWTVRELADAAGVSDSRVRQLLLDGEIKGRKTGWTWIIPNSEAQRWLDKRRE